ncbi:SCO1/SenC-domain-containing protein [Aspergillus cavernicola]|uniref:SCO1/SenC-domain-containing protein n=1 Tax=Aspergillus cavernicola TaxID=176166 RepID=A0ABR4HZJ1_9EURO
MALDLVKAYYISVDPNRDTPGIMKTFLEKRFPKFIGLTGTKEQLESAREEFHVFAKAKEDANALGGYVVPHTAITYLLDKEGNIVDNFFDVLNAKTVTARVLEKMKNDPDSATTGENEQSSNGTKFTYEQESLKQMDPKMVQTIRHIGNLARQLKGDWANMMGAPDLNDGFGAYRYQLAFMSYALTLAHFHRLPAAPGYFKDTMERIITKMLEPDVWFYWHDASTGGGSMYTPPQPMLYDPVKKDNIMYSAYVQSMTAMFNSLFDDTRYQKRDALTFEYTATLWGEPRGWKFKYDQNSLNKQIFKNMVAEGYLGVACEPECIYQVCNQIPIIGFRMNDILTEDENLAEEVTREYVKAWQDKAGGIVTKHHLFNTFYNKHFHTKIVVPGGAGESWTGFLMNAWNHDLVQETYDKRLECLVHTRSDGTMSANTGPIELLPKNVLYLASGGIWGWNPVWAAEMGDDETRDRLLEYAEKHFNPRIQNGGLMYPRNDTVHDKEGNFVMVSPLLSNALMPLALLNVRHGLKRLYENPWGARNREHYGEPALVDVDFNVDVYRAVYIAESRTLLFDLAVYEANLKGSVTLGRVFGRGDWILKRDGDEVARGSSHSLTVSPGGSDLVDRDAPKVPSRLGWGYSFKANANAPAGINKDGDLLHLPVNSTKVVSYELQWV